MWPLEDLDNPRDPIYCSPVCSTRLGRTDPCVEYGGKPDPQYAVCCHADCDTCEDSTNHFQNNKVCSRSMMLSGYNYGTCGVDTMEAPCELPGEIFHVDRLNV